MNINALGAGLARELAGRLSVVVPESFAVSPSGDTVEVRSTRAPWVATSLVGHLLDQPMDTRTLVEIAAFNALDTVQDYVSEVLREPWPTLAGRGALSRTMALAGVAIDGDALHLWYGEREKPALSLASIKLTDLGEVLGTPR